MCKMTEQQSTSTRQSDLGNGNKTQLLNQQKSVSFRSKVCVRRTLHLEDYTKEEHEACWYTVEEMKTIRVGVRKCVLEISKGTMEETDSEDFTLRGLESFLPEGQALKDFHREAARSIVLEEQDFQWKHGLSDPEVLADLYHDHTRHSASMAQIRGLSDQEESFNNTGLGEDSTQRRLSLKRPNKDLSHPRSTLGSLRRIQPSSASNRAA